MGTVTDTLRTAENLREAGVPDRQAVAHASAVESGCAEATRGFVTENYLRKELADLERRLILWAVGVGVTVGAASVSILVQLLG